MEASGVWLPVVTPFLNNEVDYASFERLIEHYVARGIKGLIPLGTTGEAPVVKPDEAVEIIRRTVAVVADRIPVFAGIGGNDTAQVISRARQAESLGIEGILSVCPYYSRPGEDGLYAHFKALARATPLDIIMYNIPCRTGVNMRNSLILRLAEIDNIIGIKDACGDISQTLALLSRKPDNFSVLAGEDHLFFTNLANGGNGGILASAHIETEIYTEVFERMAANDVQAARAAWRRIERQIPLWFEESNPGPVKHALERLGLITSCEMRLPMTGISEGLRDKIDRVVKMMKNYPQIKLRVKPRSTSLAD